jgi:hypothetical protein
LRVEKHGIRHHERARAVSATPAPGRSSRCCRRRRWRGRRCASAAGSRVARSGRFPSDLPGTFRVRRRATGGLSYPKLGASGLARWRDSSVWLSSRRGRRRPSSPGRIERSTGVGGSKPTPRSPAGGSNISGICLRTASQRPAALQVRCTAPGEAGIDVLPE